MHESKVSRSIIEDECPDHVVNILGGKLEKYKYKPLSEIPSKALYWIAENCSIEWLCVAADKVWRWREKNGEHWEEEDRL